ncbi:MAG TPA: glycoside hydrolase family 2 TIM barrel-domain containing protein [Chthoniobacteraceae bacterium]|jgi:beta-galactosidase|nr:glycoside hydrolase family 2 TIM barrel-domain containing protein [Chthoniobacteraceae bacterium]
MPRYLRFVVAVLIAVLPGALAAQTAASSWPAFSTAGFFAVPGSPRRVLDFDPGWRFLKADAPGAESPAYDDSRWQTANVPHGLELLPENASGMRNYQGPAWYRKHFRTPPHLAGGRTVLYFEAVMGKCAVWVNGRKIAEHFGGYLPFAADVTDDLAANGGDNVVAVRADNSDDPTYPPGKPQSALDFTYCGGIYRDVYLIETGGVRVTLPELSQTVAGGGVFVATRDLNAQAAQIEVRTEVENRTAMPGQITLRTVLEDANFHPLLEQDQAFALGAGIAKEAVQELTPRLPHLWTPNDPYLHYIRTDVIENGAVVDSLRTRFGIRILELKGKDGLYINHAPIGYKLNGANRHQDYVYVGNALPKSGQWRDAKLLREGGCEVIRAAHYPMSPAFMDACDALGLLVTCANPGWQFFPQTNAQLFTQRVLQDSHNMVRRDRNHPALFLWETTLNETWNMPPGLPKQMSQAVHEEDPFPGCFTAADAKDAIPAGMDMPYSVGAPKDPNQIYFTREYGDWVDNFSTQNSPVRVWREWGEHALNLQASIRDDQISGIYNSPPAHVGGALWAGIDHQRGYNPDPFLGGLLDLYRVPRYSYYLYKSQYDPGLKVPGISTGPMVYICHELTYISEPDVVVYTNCQQVRLTWMGKVYTQGPEPGRHEPHPPVIFKNVFDMHPLKGNPDELHEHANMIAEGLINGQVVCREVKPYPQRTVGLRLEVDDQGVPLQADASDFVPVRAYIVDRYGATRVLENGYIHFQVDGPGSIIGDASNQANPMKAEFGVATGLVRAGLTPGVIHVTATCFGLKPATVDIPIVPPSIPLW